MVWIYYVDSGIKPFVRYGYYHTGHIPDYYLLLQEDSLLKLLSKKFVNFYYSGLSSKNNVVRSLFQLIS